MDVTVRAAESKTVIGSGSVAPRSFLQTPFWAEFKASHGWKPFYFFVQAGEGERYPLIVLARDLGVFGTLAYVPLGPDSRLLSVEDPGRRLLDLARQIVPLIGNTVLCVRFDPPIDGLGPLPKGLRKASVDVQPPDTVILDLRPSEEELLDGMKQKWRYNVRLGEKKGVEIRVLTGREASAGGIDTFYGLYRETASRDGIAIHDKAYYRDLFTAAEEGPFPADIRLYIASHEGVDLAAIVVLFSDAGATYLYGASSNEKRNLMPAYALQWRAIRDAKAVNCPYYDFYGIPPSDAPSHPMHGLYRFKTGFGGSIVHRAGSYDAPVSGFRYFAWSVAEIARTAWYKKLKKLLRKGIPKTS